MVVYVRVSIDVIFKKKMAKSNLGKQGFVSTYPQVTAHHCRKSGQELKQRQQTNTAHSLVHHDLLTLLSYSIRTISPEEALHTAGWALLYKSSIKKMHHRFAHRLIWWVHFLYWSSFFPNSSSLGQVDIRLFSTMINCSGDDDDEDR